MAPIAMVAAVGLCVAGCAMRPAGVPAWAKVSAEQLAAAQQLKLPVAAENSVGMRFVLIPAGRFRMGSPSDQNGHMDGETLHRVHITQPFYLGIYEVIRLPIESRARECVLSRRVPKARKDLAGGVSPRKIA